MNRLRVRLFAHLAGQEIGFFDRVRTGELMNRLAEVIGCAPVVLSAHGSIRAWRPLQVLCVGLFVASPMRQ